MVPSGVGQKAGPDSDDSDHPGCDSYAKTRYRGLTKNTAQLVTLFALSNLWMVRGKLMEARG